MFHYYQTPAILEVARYLIQGNREFYTHKPSMDAPLQIRFLASEEYVKKMQARPFLKHIPITIKA